MDRLKTSPERLMLWRTVKESESESEFKVSIRENISVQMRGTEIRALNKSLPKISVCVDEFQYYSTPRIADRLDRLDATSDRSPSDCWSHSESYITPV